MPVRRFPLSHAALSHALLEAIAEMTDFGVQDSFPRKRKRHRFLWAYPVSGNILLACSISSIVTKCISVVFLTESNI
jgi:hypothetical protein